MNEIPKDDRQHTKHVNKHLAKPDSLQDSPKSSEPEYRLVPVQPWDSSSHGYNSYNTDDEIDLVELLKTLWEERKTILRFTLAGAIIGILIGFLSPKMYTVTATLLPEYNSESQTGASSLLRQFGGLAGISAAPTATESLSPQLYPDIVQTLPFQLQLMEQKFYIPEADSMATLYTYLTDIKEEHGLTKVKAYTIGLPGKVIEFFIDDNETFRNYNISENSSSSSILQLTDEERDQVKFLAANVFATLDDESGVITLSVSMPDPIIAANLGKYVIEQLTEYLIDYHTSKVKRDLQFTETRLLEAKIRYEAAGLALSEFQESNQGTATARMRKGEQFFQSEYEIAFGVYNTLIQQLEQQKIKVQEQTPVFKILQPISIDLNPSKPNKLILTFLSMMLAIVFSFIVILLMRSDIFTFIKKLN